MMRGREEVFTYAAFFVCVVKLPEDPTQKWLHMRV